MPTNKEREDLKANGTVLLAYVRYKTWFASIPSNKSQEIANLSIVRSITDTYPNDKISPKIREEGVGSYSNNGDGTVNITVIFHKDISLEKGKNIISNYGGTINGNESLINLLSVTISNSSITLLAENDTVQWIEEVPNLTTEDPNDNTREVIRVNPVQAPPYNLTGIGVTIMQLEILHPNLTHPDLAGRIINIDDGGSVGDHATKDAGILIGNGSISEQEGGEPQQWRGMAPNASIISYKGGGLLTGGIFGSYSAAYDNAINDRGVNLSSNSYGAGDENGTYVVISAVYDAVIWGNLSRPIPIIGATHNYGIYDNRESWKSVNGPLSAKNTIQVGATNDSGDTIWKGSGLGPTEDGRIKPDVVAPGRRIMTTRSQGSDRHEYGSGTSGTSLSTPAVGGSIALMLEDWGKTHTHNPPLPSTLKAVLIQTAKDINLTGPDFRSGYGRINTKRAIDLIDADTGVNIIEDKITDQGEEHSYYFYVSENQTEVKITLVWDDYHATLNNDNEGILVNDLDLNVTAPNGIQYYPWTLDTDWIVEEGGYWRGDHDSNPAVRNQEDHNNNVEQVYVNTSDYGGPLTGIWNISVKGTEMGIPIDIVQNYSLVTNAPLQDSSKLYIQNSSTGENVAWLGDKGNIVLKGNCTYGGACNAPDGSFIIKNNVGETVSYIDSEGNMCIESGDCSDRSSICDPINDAFVIQNESGSNMIFLDNTGDLCLTGVLFESKRNSHPRLLDWGVLFKEYKNNE